MNARRALEILRKDAEYAESTTICNRRGTAARACMSFGDVEVTEAMAFNGSPHCSSTEGSCGCVHAEQRLVMHLVKARCSRGLTLLTTLEPCESCANLLVESELFASVFYLRPYRGSKGTAILARAGIPCVKLE